MRHAHNLRKLARGMPCMARFVGVCNGDPATSVLAHIRRGHTAGMGQKPEDLIGVVMCSECHSSLDGRRKDRPSDGDILEALCRQLDYYVKRNMVTW